MNKFSERFRELMEEKQVDVKTLSSEIAVTEGTIYKWLRGKDLLLPNLLKLADYFECSLDYLMGRNDDLRIVHAKPCPPFSIRLKEVLAELKVSQYKIVKNSRISRSQFHGWFHGANPTGANLIVLANSLDCTIDYLVGRE